MLQVVDEVGGGRGDVAAAVGGDCDDDSCRSGWNFNLRVCFSRTLLLLSTFL